MNNTEISDLINKVIRILQMNSCQLITIQLNHVSDPFGEDEPFFFFIEFEVFTKDAAYSRLMYKQFKSGFTLEKVYEWFTEEFYFRS